MNLLYGRKIMKNQTKNYSNIIKINFFSEIVSMNLSNNKHNF